MHREGKTTGASFGEGVVSPDIEFEPESCLCFSPSNGMERMGEGIAPIQVFSWFWSLFAVGRRKAKFLEDYKGIAEGSGGSH